MIDGFLRGLRQPEYVHVLLNPLPVYGLLIAWIGLLIAVCFKEPPRSDRHISAGIHQLDFRMASL